MRFSKASTEGYLTNTDAETEGVKVEVNDQVAFIIRRAGGRNQDYRRALTEGYKKHKRRIDVDAMSNEELEEKILRPAFIKHVVVDWEGVEDENGDDVPFTLANCAEYFRVVPDVYATLSAIASDISYFRTQDDKEVAEELGKS